MGVRPTGGDTTIPVMEIPHAECRQTVLGALEEVVKSVVEEKESTVDERASRVKREPDSTLREGVRKWLNEIEDGL